jgi:hypothetical protein
MSTSYDVHCRTCDEAHGFFDTDRQEALMADLIRCAPLIAACAPFERAMGRDYPSPRLRFDGERYGSISAEWFEKHLGHDLAVRDEYGGFSDECCEWFRCPSCGHQERCRKPQKHDGEHAGKPKPV